VSDSVKAFPPSLKERVTRLLACAAINPALRSILVFNSTPNRLRQAAQTISQMLEILTGHIVDVVTLGTYEAEDDLWGSWGLGSESGEHLLRWKPGLLFQPITEIFASGEIPVASTNKSHVRLVVIPDLTKLSLAAARACVVLMGAEVAHLERHGKQASWQPNICWMAGCTSSEVGLGSLHLLDRFALRLSGLVAKTTDRTGSILEFLDEPVEKEKQPEPLPIEICACLQKALQVHPRITDKALRRIFDYTIELEVYSPRREIALARLSVANARLEGAENLTEQHVDTAAELIKLMTGTKQKDKRSNLASKQHSELFKPTETTSNSTPSPSQQLEPLKQLEPIYESDELEALSAVPLTSNATSVNPYPEDEAPVEQFYTFIRMERMNILCGEVIQSQRYHRLSQTNRLIFL
jgi:magnesium chelatase subunit D